MPDSPGDQSTANGGGIVLHIASTAIPDGRAAMRVRVTGSHGIHHLAVSHLALVLLATASQRKDGALIAPLNLRQAMSDRIAEEISLLVRLGLAESLPEYAAEITPLGRAVLDAIENED